MHQARVAVAPRAADARALGAVGLVEQDAARRVERVVARPSRGRRTSCWIRGSCDTAGHGYGLLAVALGRVLAGVAVHLVEPLGLRVVRLEVVVGQRPRRRDAVDVLELAEVLRAQAVQRRAVQLGGAADEVVDLRLERLAVGVVPGVLRDVLAV